MPGRRFLAVLAIASAFGGTASGNECLTGDVAFSDAALSQAISKLGDETVDAAGRAALLQLYRNARANVPQWPIGNVDPTVTTRAGSKFMRNSPFATLLRNLTTVRDGLVAPLEAMDAGDIEGAQRALTDFMKDTALEGTMTTALGEGPGAVAFGAIKIYLASVEELKKEECLLAIDLDYYEATMADKNLGPGNRDRVDYYIRNYLVGGGPAPSGLDRDVHRARAQCYLESELSEALLKTRFTEAPLGVRTPFDAVADALRGPNCLGTSPADRACQAAVGAMLHDFDARRRMEEARKTLQSVRQAAEYQTLLDTVTRIADPEKVASNLCDAYMAALAETATAPAGQTADATPQTGAPAEDQPTVAPASLSCDVAMCRRQGELRDACLLAAVRRWRAPAVCQYADDKDACWAALGLELDDRTMLARNIGSTAQRDLAWLLLALKTRDFSVLPNISDNERFDGAVIMAALFAHDWTEGRPPPADWCGQMRGNYVGDYPTDAIGRRNLCEALVAALNSFQGPDQCRQALPARVQASPFDDGLQDTQVKTMNACYGLLDRMEHAARLPPEWREAAIAQLARGEIDLKARELQLPAIDEGPSPTTNAATPDEPPTIREPSAMPDFPWCGTGEPTVLIQDPTIGGNGVDACLTWGADCGQPAADEWCRRQGRGPAVYHHIERGPPTQTLRDGKGCSESFCARLTKVVCAASPAVATELAPPAVSICPTLVGVRDSPLDESRHYLITYFGGATMYYPHKSEDILCGYGTITTSQFTGEHLVPEGGGYGLYVMVNGDLRKIAEYAKTGTEIDASGISWDVGKWKDLAKGNAGDWRGRWVAH